MSEKARAPKQLETTLHRETEEEEILGATEVTQRKKVEENKRKTQADLQSSTLMRANPRAEHWSSKEPRGGTGRGRGGRGSTMPQCGPSARPRDKAQWLHCQQALSCTFRGLPDTRPLPSFTKQHNNLFRGPSNGLLLGRRPERDHSALNGRCLRWFLSLLWFSSFQCYHWHAMGEWEIITMLLLTQPWAMAANWKTIGVENIVVHSRRQSAEFSGFCLNGWIFHSGRQKSEIKWGMNDAQKWCPSKIHEWDRDGF